MKEALLEGLLVVVLGGLLAFAANGLSPRGLQLTRDYFHGEYVVSPAPPNHGQAGGTNAGPSATEALVERLKAKGLQVVEGDQALQLFNDPRREQGLIAFIDARPGDEHYREGHIPGAWQFDHFHPENQLATILPACQTAQQIVVYCNGGECEDSEFAAMFLKDTVKVPPEKLFVYAGGIKEWESAGRPVELGERNSGQMRKETK